MSDKSNPKAKPSSASKKNPAIESVSYYVDQLAMALGQVIPPERTVLYVRALSDLTEQQLAYGFEQALKLFAPQFGQTFPSPAQIREWGFQWRPQAITDSSHILDRGDKPHDWGPLKPGELEEMRREARKRAEELQAQIESAVKHENTMPKASDVDQAEWDRRRQKQIDDFRRKNAGAGEA